MPGDAERSHGSEDGGRLEEQDGQNGVGNVDYERNTARATSSIAAVQDSANDESTSSKVTNDERTPRADDNVVRLSTDLETDARGKKRKSNEIARDVPIPQPGFNAAGLPQATPGTNGRHDGAARNAPSSNIQTGADSMALPTPTATKSRTRGMSMRSSLFARNMERKPAPPETVVEMTAVPSSSDGVGSTERPEKSLDNTVPRTPRQLQDPVVVSAFSSYRKRAKEQTHRYLPVKRIEATYKKARKFVLGFRDIPPSKDGRHVPVDPGRDLPLVDDRTGKPYINNFIKSSKCNAWNFLPRQLFAQFSKLANFYFLTVSILQMIPGLSTTGTYTTIVPLMFFVALSMGKEGYEDFRRHRLDKVENNKEAMVLRSNGSITSPERKGSDMGSGQTTSTSWHWVPVKWRSLRVGEIVKLERDDSCPADVLLLDSKGANNIAYIESMALDGETNLKNKQPPGTLIGKCSTPEGIAALQTDIVVEDPNLDLYSFEGKVAFPDGSSPTPLTNNEVIYRGSILRNTPEATGMIIHTGEECKMRMNANKNPRIKAPTLQSMVNKIVIMMVFFVLVLSLGTALTYQTNESFEARRWYLTDARVAFGPVFTSLLIMFNTLIPLSLYISLEIVKVAQMLMLNDDIDMYDEKSNTPLEAHTSTINEELGQVSYVFSDKTGTLTENVMRFRKLSVAGTAWLHDTDLKAQSEDDLRGWRQRFREADKNKRPSQWLSRKSTTRSSKDNARSGSQTPRQSTTSWRSPAMPNLGQPELNTADMIQYIQRRPHTAFARKASMMILSMAICHTCIPEQGKSEGDISFQASSPDELALVEAAKDLGYLAFHREMATLTLKTYPKGLSGEPVIDKYKILDVVEFSSKRKRMSVIVRFPDGRICVMCKGADSVIMERLRLADLAQRKVAEIEQRVNQRRGLGAEQVLQRKSIAAERNGSVASISRPSLSRPRPSRTSTGMMTPTRDNVEGWLEERESEPTTPIDQSHYSPRPSAQLARHSTAYSSRQNSLQLNTNEEDLVEESLVMDDSAVIERCFQHINDFATEGLRTLLYGHRFLDDAEYLHWKKIYQEATVSLIDRQKMIEEAGELVERDLELGGATAIEDKLQEGVPETIDRLRRAEIKMWMLTGDKRETAINIGHSCRLIKDYSSLTILDHVAGGVEQSIATAIANITGGGIAHSVVIVDGQTLGTIQAEEQQHPLFLDLAILADSVICCRASPSQKSGLVHAIRQRVNQGVTLAIGDGANDIAMIQEAHVGIGITGKEGLQAARVSDYSIAQFRFLSKLLLVHGRWNYIRICKYTVGTFWKEMLFYLTQALYQRHTAFSGTSLYEQWSLTLFNTLFTSLPIIFLGIFEKDLAASTLLAVPELYTKGQRGDGFNFRVYAAWMFMAAAEAMIVFYTMLGLYGQVKYTWGWDLFSMGVLSYTVCVVLINTKLQLIEQRYKSTVALACMIIEVGGWFLWNIILSFMYSDNQMMAVKGGFVDRFGQNVLWWIVVVLATASCIVFELAVRAIKCALWPTDVETFQELEKDPVVRKRFEDAAREELRQGWEYGRVGVGDDAVEEKQREGKVQEILERPRTLEEGREKGDVGLENNEKYGADALFATRYGRVKR